jgi:hypothetical protein
MSFKQKKVKLKFPWVLIWFVFFSANYPKDEKSIDRLSTNEIDSLMLIYGHNKTILPDFKEQILIALTYFPEFKDYHIAFKYSEIHRTMVCRPKIKSFIKKEKEYVIYININKNFGGVLLKDVSFNAQIGVIGHELGHINDYEKRTKAGIITRGIDYLNKRSKKAFEYKIDSITIEKGLGWQLYEWAQYSMFDNEISTEEYKKFKKETYMQPEMIKKYINELEIYK